MPGSHHTKAAPKPTARPCRFCDDAVWRFNGRTWYSSDLATRRRHVCQVEVVHAAAGSDREANGRADVHGLPERLGVTVAVLAAAALAALGGLCAARLLSR